MSAKRKNQQPQQPKPPEVDQTPSETPSEVVEVEESPKKTGVFVCKGKSVTCGAKIKSEGDEITEKDGFDEKSLSDLLKNGVIEIVK